MPIIVGDIAGRFDELMLLLKKCPDDEVISVGDMIDRGSQSREVVEWFMKNGKAILGNHEHLAVDFCRYGESYYSNSCWFNNGGYPTLASFDGRIPEDVLTWMEFLPKYMIVEGCLISHSFVRSPLSLQDSCDFGTHWADPKCDESIIWNRRPPIRRDKYKMQIAGHNSQYKLRKFTDEKGDYAICIDDSANKKLTAIHLPSYTIYHQEFIK